MSVTIDEGPLYLSIDAGTTKYRACVLNERLEVVWVEQVDMDQELSEYGTRNGVYTMGDQVTCPSELRLKALDLLLEKLAHQCPDDTLVGRVVAVSGSGQPHALHYLSPAFLTLLPTLDATPELRISETFTSETFSLETPATSSDTSSTPQVRSLEQHFGHIALTSAISTGGDGAEKKSASSTTILEMGRTEFTARTGSKPSARYSAAQLMKVVEGDERKREVGEETVLDNTEKIVLESGLIASIFLGRIAPVDAADACSTILFNPISGDWDDEILEFVMKAASNIEEGGKRLREMLGTIQRDGGQRLGTVSDYFVKRFGFSPDCIVAPFTGTHAATFLSFPLESSHTSRDVIVSLSNYNSDTILIPSSSFAPHPERSIFVHPASFIDQNDEGDDNNTVKYVSMISSKEAGLGRSLARDMYCNGVWSVFTRLSAIVPHGGTLGLDNKYFSFFFPHGEASMAQGFLRFVSGGRVTEFPDRKANPRLLLESQFLSLRIRLSRALAALSTVESHQIELSAIRPFDSLGFPPRSTSFLPTRVVLVGSASQNPAMSSLLSTIFNSPAYLVLSTGLTRESIEGEELEDYRGREKVLKERFKTNASALGSAYKAAWSFARSQGETESFSTFLQRNLEEQESSGLSINGELDGIGGGMEQLDVDGGKGGDENNVVPSFDPNHSRHTPRSGSGYTASSIGLSQFTHSRNSSTSEYYSNSSGFSLNHPLPRLSIPSKGGDRRRGGENYVSEDEFGRKKEIEEDPAGLTLVALPDSDEFKYYSSMMYEHTRLEKHALKGLI